MSSALRPLAVLGLVSALAVTAAGASVAAGSQSAAECCTVTYDKTKTHVQVTGTVSYKGRAVLFSFYGPCASPAGPGHAFVKSRWIPLTDIVAGYHTIKIVQIVNGKVIYTSSPRFYVKGTAQLRKPVARILSGPSGTTTATSVVFDIHTANNDRCVYRLDAAAWKTCTSRYIAYKELAPGEHVFVLRAYAPSGTGYAEATRSFTVAGP
jgi:hypothetical protein